MHDPLPSLHDLPHEPRERRRVPWVASLVLLAVGGVLLLSVRL